MMSHVKHISSPCISLLTWRLDPLHHLFRIYPKTERKFRNITRAANLEKVFTSPEFQFKKERVLILMYLLENTNGLDKNQIGHLADAVLIRRNLQTVLGLLKIAGKKDKGSTSGGSVNSAKELRKITFGTAKRSEPTREEAMWREANNFATSVSDTRFLSELNAARVHQCLRDAVAEVEETAFACLRNQVESLVDGIGQQIFTIQKAECERQIQRDVTSGEEKELGVLRSRFVHQIEDLTRDRSRSYVHSIPE
jgi:hypothetical protein